jgi:hypothetical protein
MKTQYTYTVYTAQQDGVSTTMAGTLNSAIRAAKRYAFSVFPSWIKGYGPTIKIRADSTGQIVHEERL